MTQKTYNRKKTEFGFISADPLPTEAELSEHYSSKYYNAPSTATYQTGYSQDELEQKKIRAELVVYSLSQLPDTLTGKTLFEVGCGEGFILDAAQKAGMIVEGVDFTDAGIMRMNPHLRDRMTAENAYEYLERTIASGRTFDACVIQNVLEHVIDPDRMLGLLKSILKPNGLLLVNVPNDYSALQELALQKGYIERDFWFGPVEHLHYFNTENLPPYIGSKGFIVRDMFGDFPIDIFLLNEHANYIADKSRGKAAHNARIMLDLLMSRHGMAAYHRFCQAMSGVGIGRNICVVAQKKEE